MSVTLAMFLIGEKLSPSVTSNLLTFSGQRTVLTRISSTCLQSDLSLVPVVIYMHSYPYAPYDMSALSSAIESIVGLPFRTYLRDARTTLHCTASSVQHATQRIVF